MKRDSRFELLRIVSMFLIILSHFEGWGQSDRLTALNGHFLRGGIAASYLSIGKLGAFLFIMITGYFIGNKKYSESKALSKALMVWSYAFYYSVLLLLLVILIGIAPFSKQMLIQSIFPFFTNAYWFVDAYIILMLFLPYLNNIIISCTQKSLAHLIILLIITGNIMCQLGNIMFTTNSAFGYILPAYFIGAYLHKYGCYIYRPYVKAVLFYLIVILCSAIDYKYFAGARSGFFTDGPFQIIIAILIFVGVMNQETFYNKQINFFAKTVFAAYLITDNDYFRSTVWSFFSFHSVSNLLEVNLLGILSVILLLLLLFVIDQIRIFLFNKLKLKVFINKMLTEVTRLVQ